MDGFLVKGDSVNPGMPVFMAVGPGKTRLWLWWWKDVVVEFANPCPIQEYVGRRVEVGGRMGMTGRLVVAR